MYKYVHDLIFFQKLFAPIITGNEIIKCLMLAKFQNENSLFIFLKKLIKFDDIIMTKLTDLIKNLNLIFQSLNNTLVVPVNYHHLRTIYNIVFLDFEYLACSSLGKVTNFLICVTVSTLCNHYILIIIIYIL